MLESADPENKPQQPVSPEEQFQKSYTFWTQRIYSGPQYANFSLREKSIRVYGELYNNWPLKFPLREGPRFGIDPVLVSRVDMLAEEIGIPQYTLEGFVDELKLFASLSNPVFLDIDRVTRPLLLEMIRRHQYTLLELVR